MQVKSFEHDLAEWLETPRADGQQWDLGAPLHSDSPVWSG